LKPLGYYLSIETNGTINIPPGIIDWICVSPKDQEYADIKIRQKTGDELKIVYLGQSLEMYDKLRGGFDYHLLQPCYDENKDIEWNGNNFKSTVEVVKNNPGWNLSLQTHKWMGVD
jgi:organic radical activating enzyme